MGRSTISGYALVHQLAIAAVCLLVIATRLGAKPVPVESLWRPAALEKATLSPDGQFVAAIQTDDRNVRHLVLVDLNKNELQRIPGREDLSFQTIGWIDDQRALATCLADNGGLAIYVIPRDQPAERYAPFGLHGLDIVGYPAARPDHAIVAYFTKESYDARVVHEIDLNTRLEERYLWENAYRLHPPVMAPAIKRNNHTLPTSYRSNLAGELSWAVAGQWDGRRFFRFDRDNSDWIEVDLPPSQNWLYVAEPDNRTWWVATDTGAATSTLGRFDTESGEFAPSTWSDAAYDLSRGAIYYSNRTHQVVGYSIHRKRLEYDWLDENYALAFQAAIQLHPNFDHRLLSTSRDDRRFLFESYHGASRGQLVLVDLADRSVHTITALSAQLDSYQLNIPKAVTFRTRDGRALDGYLTLPTQIDPAQKPALIVVNSDQAVSWTYSPWVHYFNSRGYAVMQVDDLHRQPTPPPPAQNH